MGAHQHVRVIQTTTSGGNASTTLQDFIICQLVASPQKELGGNKFLVKLHRLTEAYSEQQPVLFGSSAHPATREQTGLLALTFQRAGFCTDFSPPPQVRRKPH